MQESCTYGSMRGAPSNGRPYRNRGKGPTLRVSVLFHSDFSVGGEPQRSAIGGQPGDICSLRGLPPVTRSRCPDPVSCQSRLEAGGRSPGSSAASCSTTFGNARRYGKLELGVNRKSNTLGKPNMIRTAATDSREIWSPAARYGSGHSRCRPLVNDPGVGVSYNCRPFGTM